MLVLFWSVDCFLSEYFETKGHQEMFWLHQEPINGCPKIYFSGCWKLLVYSIYGLHCLQSVQFKSRFKWHVWNVIFSNLDSNLKILFSGMIIVLWLVKVICNFYSISRIKLATIYSENVSEFEICLIWISGFEKHVA